MAPQPAQPPAETTPPLEPQRTRSSSYGLARRSTTERINAILETGRERAERERASTSSNPPDHPMPRHPNRTRAPALDRPNGDHDESSADESSRIVSRGDRVSYQSTVMSEPRPRLRHTESAQQRDSAVENEYKGRRDPWYLALFAPFKSIELENKGSVARDHLAIERTFLAWLRTSLAFTSIGIAVTQLFRLNTSLEDTDSQSRTLRQLGKPLGATFLAISIVILFLGYRRFIESQRWVIQGKFPASRGVVLLVSFLAFALTVASLVVVVIVHPKEREL